MEKVSIITPTNGRQEDLINITIPSVKMQSYLGGIEHIIIGDGVQEGLSKKLSKLGVTYIELGRNWHQFTNKASFGAIPRLVGTLAASGQYIGYIDDDDQLLPQHVEVLIKAMKENGTSIAFSKMVRYLNGKKIDVIGDGKIEYGHVGTPMIMHRAECLLAGNWRPTGYDEDYQFYKRFYDLGIDMTFVPEVTVKVNKNTPPLGRNSLCPCGSGKKYKDCHLAL